MASHSSCLADHIYLFTLYLLTNRTNLASNVVQNQNKIDKYIKQNYKNGQIKSQKWNIDIKKNMHEWDWMKELNSKETVIYQENWESRKTGNLKYENGKLNWEIMNAISE